jgi:hypothetical protein
MFDISLVFVFKGAQEGCTVSDFLFKEVVPSSFRHPIIQGGCASLFGF